MIDEKTLSVQRKYNRFAKYFELMEGHMAGGKFAKYRQELWQNAKGKVLEVGVGTGINFPYYPQDKEVIGIDFSEKMLERAIKKKEQQRLNVRLMQMDAQNMTFDNDIFDTVFTTCVFCTVPDPVKGLKEIHRVLKPEGKLYMLEHVRSCKPFLGLTMDFINPFIYGLVGTHINRQTLRNLVEAEFKIEDVDYLMSDILLSIVATPIKE